METLHALSIAEVAVRIVGLIPTVLSGLIPGAGVLISGALLLYRLALDTMALSAAHREFGIGKSLLSLALGAVMLSVFLCCGIFALVFALGGRQ